MTVLAGAVSAECFMPLATPVQSQRPQQRPGRVPDKPLHLVQRQARTSRGVVVRRASYESEQANVDVQKRTQEQRVTTRGTAPRRREVIERGKRLYGGILVWKLLNDKYAGISFRRILSVIFVRNASRASLRDR
jgi:hypothetical protein